ncbi:Transforming growth factor-beta, C-terminal domain-containing protein [Strongyloides ratti]|uniref:Transforming growth factor-beta, C-terminal domain-containing protein n=1 Tax=Strongyloides ratti TaxID=34506 RepID=A0A090KYP8_STRRB|nr:Transforming growth factor-beta, C-terminal domain-containing protein [Strongyloides ratti]CEF60339.1 Transforming growth factor-beta, C-terminal domain-containing protein [Strongyloides ratti]
MKVKIYSFQSIFFLSLLVNKLICECSKSKLSKEILDEFRINQFLYEFNRTLSRIPGKLITNFNLTKTLLENNRKIRSINECGGKDGKSCCKKKLKINLHSVGFNFILNPINVDIGNCIGSCILNDNQFPNAKLLRISGISTKQKTSCCFPDAFEKQYFYIYTEKGVVMKAIDHMFVETCRCT